MEGFNLWVFLGVTVVLFGGCAFLMGQAIAVTWRPFWHSIPYGLLLGLGHHFITAALFGVPWGSLANYLLGVLVIIVSALFAYRVTMVRKMVRQYPWLYEQTGLLSWRDREKARA